MSKSVSQFTLLRIMPRHLEMSEQVQDIRMEPTGGWQATKVGPGPNPSETNEGWLLFYHGVLTSCNGFVYSFGAVLLDLDQPWKVLYRTAPYLMSPQTLYECVGDVPNVVFPCATLVDAPTGRMAIYYGGADTVVGLAFGYLDEIVQFIKDNSRVSSRGLGTPS